MKILILSESIAGSGHNRAAENVAKGFKRHVPTADIKVDTSLTHVSPLLEKLSNKLYMGAIRHAAPIWGWAYRRDKEWSLMGKNVLKKYIAKKMIPYLEKERPDIVVSTHAFCLGGLAELKSSYSFRLGAALTDYWVNPFWIHDEIDAYFVGATSLKKKMIADFGMDSERIHVTGIPIDPIFEQSRKQLEIREQHSVPQHALFILVTGGGLGLLPYREILNGLSRVAYPLYVAVLAGTNQQAKKDLEDYLVHNPFPHPVIIMDYVNNIHEWMQSADLLIGKPGGLTVSEALASHLPMLIYKPIPGQEERNSQFLLAHEVGMRATGVDELTHRVTEFCLDEDRSKRWRERIQPFSKPSSAVEVGKIMLTVE
ncbi:glycosyltransferase [Ammoniphilus sp. CFH 90114]|uniref:MGDG synthase family glycosyltransferase n=1 Tax=Ammoniphilus sp. CFH 90114 TaxID=2493665 RepID=UPI00100FC8CA|nr:glycosyltransferase [Ammoniphilus sp. CFH 90114]RXT13573.1 hypothetical protein EIZ39_05320 [Ammoniphilus sp. CFH 90114]